MPVTIRSRLLLLVLSVLLPGALGVGWLIENTFAAERASQERMLRDTTRALSMVVEREIVLRAAVARVLSRSRALDAGAALDATALADFHADALRAVEGLDGWVELRAAGRTLLDTRQPPGHAAPAPGTSPELAAAAAVRPLQAVAQPEQAHAEVTQPVVRDGRAVLNVVVTLRPRELQRIVDAHSLPADRYGTVVDSNGVVVARHPGGAAFMGRSVPPELRARIAAAAEDRFESVTLDGVKAVGYYRRAASGWTTIGGIRRDQIAGLLPQAVVPVAIGSVLLLGLALAGTLWVSRRIVAPVLALKAAAAKMQAGEPVERRSTGIVECDQVALALAEAAESIGHARADLERQVADAVAKTRAAEQRISQSQRVEALGRLTGGVAHDFNNLLGIVSNSLHLIERHPAADELQMPIAASRRAVDAGSQLTQHLLRFTGHRPLRTQTVSLSRYLPEMQPPLTSVLGRRVQVSVDVDPETAPVRVDPDELELALVNLALNARDAMPGGGVLRIAARNAGAEDAEGLPALPGRRWVLLTVGDDGVGVDAPTAARAFEPFFTTKGVGKGSGLGLSQVHGFCVQAGGAARLDSVPGLGTTVSLVLPSAGDETSATPTGQAGDGAAGAGQPPGSAPDDAGVGGARVLLVEDNLELADVTSALLQAHGAVVERAVDAAQAQRKLTTAPRPDVVLSDVVMPGAMDGLALARWIRREHAGLPVVLISAFNTAASTSEFAVLRKPCPPAELLAALRDAMRSERSASAASPSPRR